MAESLNPTPAGAIAAVLRADWTRTTTARRIAAGVLVLLAGVAALRPDPATTAVEVVVSTRDVRPGTTLTSDDIAIQRRSAGTVPDGALTSLPAALGATVAAPVHRGETLTDLRLLGRRLTEATAGPDARLVAVHPADAALLDLLRPGDIVDVVAVAQSDPAAATARLVATGGVVVLVSTGRHTGADDRAVLLALPAGAATEVAAATLVHAVTLTVR